MSTTTWTPGEWVVLEGDVYCAGATPGPDGPIAQVYGTTSEEHRANCILIAAAPALFEALEAILDHVEAFYVSGAPKQWQKDGVTKMRAARTALRQARGEA